MTARTLVVGSVTWIALGLATAPGHLSAQVETEVTEEDLTQERIYSPFAGRDYPDQVLFGDTHFHTNLSFDAGLVGTRLTMDEGYRFARGKFLVFREVNDSAPGRLLASDIASFESTGTTCGTDFITFS